MISNRRGRMRAAAALLLLAMAVMAEPPAPAGVGSPEKPSTKRKTLSNYQAWAQKKAGSSNSLFHSLFPKASSSGAEAGALSRVRRRWPSDCCRRRQRRLPRQPAPAPPAPGRRAAARTSTSSLRSTGRITTQRRTGRPAWMHCSRRWQPRRPTSGVSSTSPPSAIKNRTAAAPRLTARSASMGRVPISR